MPKIFVNRQFLFNLSSKVWSHVFFGTQCRTGSWSRNLKNDMLELDCPLNDHTSLDRISEQNNKSYRNNWT